MEGILVVGIWFLFRVALPFIVLIVLGTLLQRQSDTQYRIR
jgi:hypothetical protein